jgi:large subunit ribosomal protein L16
MKVPKRTKYKKYHKNKIKVRSDRTSFLRYGLYGIKALESGRISAQHIETVRQTIGRKIRPKGRLWIRAFPHLPVTSKPSEVRMGKGKGNVSLWVCTVKKGQILYEIYNFKKSIAQDILKLGSSKIPIKTKIVYYV